MKEPGQGSRECSLRPTCICD